ncbi:CDC27 family protein [Lacihabitans soyangensis]|uniref:Tetratricopeptide repeat protein n=1 Tax=Lacihabitans soyangensis TaxID=869394 RepID=A0AAE3H6A1_9BACT|nr:CDC27 family protein [Lacihabitans soyangensis]MCP9766039.1 hypothetical protein [Lacihabitans soyangensis]
MENDTKLIDDYLGGMLSAEEMAVVEQRIMADTAFAESVAFHAQAKSILRDEILLDKHKQWTSQPKAKVPMFTILSAGIAAVLLLVAGWWFFAKNSEPNLETLAQNYIDQNLSTLPVKMDAKEDSLELGKQYYNEGEYTKALEVFEKLNDPKALEFAGLSALKGKKYPEAIQFFEKLSQNTELLENKGKFYLALTYLQQGQKQKAEVLLEEIKKEGLFGADLLDFEK